MLPRISLNVMARLGAMYRLWRAHHIAVAAAIVTTAPPTFAAEGVIISGFTSIAQRTDTIGLGSHDYDVVLKEEFRRTGVTVAGTSGNIDGDNAAQPPTYELAGRFDEIRCEFEDSPFCSIAIRWELSHRRTGQLVYRVTTRARDGSSNVEELRPKLVKAAFASLLARPRFQQLIQGNGTARGSMDEASFRECTRTALAMPEASQAIIGATVLIESGKGLGSGSIISPDGFVLTAAHVIQPGSPLSVQLPSGPVMQASLVRLDPLRDVALIRVVGATFNTCLPLRAEPVEIGEEVYAIGSPLSKELSFSLTRGIVSGFRMLEGVPLLQTDASVNPGNSGGPLVDKKGRLIGVVDFKISGRVVQGLAFAVTAAAALDGLRLRSDTSSDPILSTAIVTSSSKATEVRIDDVGDPLRAEDVPDPTTNKPSGTPATLRGAGAIVASLGLVGVGTTWLLYVVGKSHMNRSTFDDYVTANSISWAAVGAGAGLFTFSYVIGDGTKRRHVKKPIARLYGGVAPGMVTLGGEL